MSERSYSLNIRPYINVLWAVVYRDLLVWIRYPVNTVMGIVMLGMIFTIMFFGGQAVAGGEFNDALEGIVVGYFLWTLSVGAYSGIMSDIQSEASWGTLERHFLAAFSFRTIITFKAVAIVFRTFLISTTILIFMLVLTGTRLELNLFTILVISTLTIADVLGLGIAMGGLAILYKRIGNIGALLQFMFIGLISVPAVGLGWLRVLPLAHGSAMLNRAMTDDVRLWEFDAWTLALLVVTALAYLSIGYLIFNLATARARRLGVLGDY